MVFKNPGVNFVIEIITFLASVGGLPPLKSLRYFYYWIMILQRPGFEPRTSIPEDWCATNEPPQNLFKWSNYAFSVRKTSE